MLSLALLLESCRDAGPFEADSERLPERNFVFLRTAPVETVFGVPCLLKGGIAAVGKVYNK